MVRSLFRESRCSGRANPASLSGAGGTGSPRTGSTGIFTMLCRRLAGSRTPAAAGRTGFRFHDIKGAGPTRIVPKFGQNAGESLAVKDL